MSKKKLTLDKNRLVRLQDNQLDAATGGAAAGNGSTTITVTIGRAVADASADGSCCNKSCSNEAPQA
ncbi:MAG: hypothetical protein ACI81P_001292 [Neolewinella sp.]|jgi:hypothetical protein